MYVNNLFGLTHSMILDSLPEEIFSYVKEISSLTPLEVMSSHNWAGSKVLNVKKFAKL